VLAAGEEVGDELVDRDAAHGDRGLLLVAHAGKVAVLLGGLAVEEADWARAVRHSGVDESDGPAVRGRDRRVEEHIVRVR
jgi:hypothetical protein